MQQSIMTKTNKTEQVSFTFGNINAADTKLVSTAESPKNKSPHQAALHAIDISLRKTSVLREKYQGKRDSLFAVIERTLPSIVGNTPAKQRKAIAKYLVSKGHDKKYVAQTLSRVFRELYPEDKASDGGRKIDPKVQAFVDAQLKEDPTASPKELSRFFRQVSTYLAKVAKDSENPAVNN